MRPFLLIIVFALGALVPAKAQSDREGALLEAVGAFSALALYNTYIVIGATADGYISQIYEKETAINLTQEQVASMQNLWDICNKLLAPGILKDQSDRAYVSDVKTTVGLLKEESAALKGYIETGSETDQLTYNEKRNAAWSKISKLLGIEQK